MSQEELVRALADPATYPGRPAAVEHVQTHISHVFLAGGYVYKLKKAVAFSFLDFSTVERRHHYCLEELRLNRRLAPDVYVDVLPLVRDATGRVRLGGPGPALDHVVRMRRLPADRLLPRLIERGAVTRAMMEALAAHVAAFHARCPTGPAIAAHAAPDALEAAWRENLAASARFAGTLLAPEEHSMLTDFGPSFVRRHETLLRARQTAGRIREGHGDLHAEHVCFLDAPLPATDGPPVAAGIRIFDCIEFSAALRANDVAAEVAFLVMDLERLGRPDLGERFATAYAAAAGDLDLPLLLPFYACARACVRGKVEGLAALDEALPRAARDASAARARRHFALASRQAWRAVGPVLVLCGGPSGTGKSTLARALAEATGFVRLSSDELRKRRAGLAPETPAGAPVDAGLYAPEARAANYAVLAAAAEPALAAGRGVVVDATFVRRADRERFAALARGLRCPWMLFTCEAPPAVVRARLADRAAGPSVSDARWDVYLAQRAGAEPPGEDEPHLPADTSVPPETVRARVLRALWDRLEHGTRSHPRE